MKTQFETSTKHGSPRDRGMADSHYHRSPAPHYWPEGTGHGNRIDKEQMTPEQIEQYYAGYEWNEKYGSKKEYDY
jgi:hypothetical protein